jgi:hypothetical protein
MISLFAVTFDSKVCKKSNETTLKLEFIRLVTAELWNASVLKFNEELNLCNRTGYFGVFCHYKH